MAWAQDQSKPALSVLPPGLSAAGAAAQAAAQAAKAAASAAGGAAAAQAAARLTAASRLQGLGNGGVANNGSNGGVGVVGASARRMQGGGVGGATGVPGVSRCMCLVVSRMIHRDDTHEGGCESGCWCLALSKSYHTVDSASFPFPDSERPRPGRCQ